MDVLFLAGAESPTAAARAITDVAAASALGELASLEEVIELLVRENRVPVNGPLIRALWAQATCGGVPGGDAEATAVDQNALKASALTVLAMAAAKHPEIVAPHVDHAAGVLELACTKKKPTLARAAASLLKCARPGGNAGTPDSMGVAAPALAPDATAFAALAKVLSPCSPLPGRGWYPAAEQSIAALYALHPDPEGAAGDVLRSFAAAAFPGAENDGGDGDGGGGGGGGVEKVNAAYLARFLFVLGEVALRHLVHAENLGRAVRRARMQRDRKA